MKTDYYASSLSYRPLAEAGDDGSLNFGQILAALHRKLLLIGGVTVLVATATAYKAFTAIPVYKAQFEILTQPVTAESQVISTLPDTLSSKDQQDNGIDSTKLKVLTSPTVLQPIVDRLQTRYPQITYGRLVKHLELSASKSNRNVLLVSYESGDSEQVQTILETISQAYLDYSLESRQGDIRQGITFVREQLPLLRDRVEQLQQQLQNLRRRNAIVDPAAKGEQLTGQVNTFSQQQLEVEVQLKQLRAVAAQLQTQSGESATSSALDSAPRYQALKNQLLALDSQRAETSALFLPKSPDMRLLDKQRQSLVALLEEETENVQAQLNTQIQELEERDRALQETLSSLNGNINQLSGISREYDTIQSELQIAIENLNQFLTKQASLEIEAAQREIPWQLLTPPSQPQVSTASIERNVVLGILLGLVLGIALVLLLDKLSKTIHSTQELKRITPLPLLGVIPHSDRLSRSDQPDELATLLMRSPTDHPPTKAYTAISFVEALRSLSTNIRLLNPNAPIRALVVSSAVSGEGKSTVALGLAQATAAMGRRVLLVDADLRHPQVHHLAQVSNQQGLTHVIVGDITLDEAVQRSPLSNNLFVLTAGAVPPDATQFLASPKMQALLEQSLDQFDLIIYDTPPLLGFADASLMTAYANGLLLVTGLGKLKSTLLEQALEQLQVTGISVLGLVATGSKDLHTNAQEVYPSYYPQPTHPLLASQSSPGTKEGHSSNNIIDLQKIKKP
ncbi:MAG: polysaccharide biosynthesis tyrosine autokinase [Oculatellaceae cyanobacterium Prado106]|jgi:capsular exopolysaccharide synthesis family protein|nr:polysaccharide biosynthesis tyrosine autokinase [Oculatellaceae cyanobacterium Prado106]